MELLNPTVLWALPLGALPILIYYLMRFRSLRVPWGAHYVLERALERLRKKLYWDQLLLLALRTLACLVLVLAFARPTASDPAARLSGSNRHHVILLDGSYSMTAGPPGETRWDLAQAALTELLAGWGRGETWSLALLGEEAQWLVPEATVQTPGQPADVLAGRQPGETSARLAPVLAELGTRFAGRALNVYLFTDDQATTWAGAEAVALPDGTRTYWLDAPLPERRNLAVTGLAPESEWVLRDHPVSVRARVRNFSQEPVRGEVLQLFRDGEPVARETLSLLPGQEVACDFVVRFRAAGSHRLSARLAGDALAWDDEHVAAVTVHQAVHLLVLRDPEARGKFDSPWEFLRLAAETQELDGAEGSRVFTLGALRCRLHEAPELPQRQSLAPGTVVLLDGARRLDAPLAQWLAEWVRDGGGLLLAADERVNAGAWNRLLGEAEILPAALGEVQAEPLGGERYQSLALPGLADGPLAAFGEPGAGNLEEARFYAWRRLEPAADARILARFGDRRPFAVSRRGELGRVVLLATGLRGRSNNLVVREFWYPLVFRLAGFAAAGSQPPCRREPGQPLRLRLLDPSPVDAVTLDLPGNEPVALTITPQGSYRTATYAEGAARSGLGSFLVLRGGRAERHYVGIQGQRVDSDLAPLAAARIEALRAHWGLVRVTGWAELEQSLRAHRGGREWHAAVLAGLLLLLLGEMLLSWRFV